MEQVFVVTVTSSLSFDGGVSIFSTEEKANAYASFKQKDQSVESVKVDKVIVDKDCFYLDMLSKGESVFFVRMTLVLKDDSSSLLEIKDVDVGEISDFSTVYKFINDYSTLEQLDIANWSSHSSMINTFYVMSKSAQDAKKKVLRNTRRILKKRAFLE
jgi:hypothetical protein